MFPRETNEYAAFASNGEFMTSDGREHGSQHRRTVDSNQECSDFYNIVPIRSRDRSKEKADMEHNLSNASIKPRRLVLPGDRNCNYEAVGGQHEYRSSRSCRPSDPEPILDRRSAVQHQCYFDGNASVRW
jgi:hypothetical protein